eukprot:COSAG01_NODE_6114_length_3843_cov_2.175481_5_plen_87_part_00
MACAQRFRPSGARGPVCSGRTPPATPSIRVTYLRVRVQIIQHARAYYVDISAVHVEVIVHAPVRVTIIRSRQFSCKWGDDSNIWQL